MPKTHSKKTTSHKKQIERKPGSTHQTRRLQLPQRHWYNPLTWRHQPPVPVYKPLSKARVLFWVTLQRLWAQWYLFVSIAIVYGVLNLLLVKGLSDGSNLTSIKSSLDSLLHGQGFGGEVSSSLGTFVALLAGSGSATTETSGIYQSVLLIVCSLAFIWALRQTIAGHAVRVRDSFYQGMYPLVPFVLTFMLLGLQLVPLVVGGGFYSLAVSSGIAAHAWEKAGCLVVFILLGFWSLRMITATIFALYVVTLPDMTPLRAYRSARQLVYGRRLLLWRKLIFLPVMLLLLAAAIELPLILGVTAAATWVFFGLSTLALPVVHGYLYNLYREML